LSRRRNTLGNEEGRKGNSEYRMSKIFQSNNEEVKGAGRPLKNPAMSQAPTSS